MGGLGERSAPSKARRSCGGAAGATGGAVVAVEADAEPAAGAAAGAAAGDSLRVAPRLEWQAAPTMTDALTSASGRRRERTMMDQPVMAIPPWRENGRTWSSVGQPVWPLIGSARGAARAMRYGLSFTRRRGAAVGGRSFTTRFRPSFIVPAPKFRRRPTRRFIRRR